MSITFALLGPVRAHRDGRELRLGTPQQRGTLAVLLLRAGRLVTLDELVHALWERPPETAVAAVRTYLSRLRRVLDAPPGRPRVRIDWRGGGYVLLAPAYSLDVTRFQQHTLRAADALRRADLEAAAFELRGAVSLHRGRPLSGTAGRAFLDAHAVRLSEMCRDAALDLAAVTVDLGRPAEAVPRLRDLLADHPLSERGHALLITALYRAGHRPEALDHYRRTCRILDDQLGLAPGPDLRDLAARIARGEPDPGPAGDRTMLGTGTAR
ncbi:MAG TPA: BTAD domain-containing putative transcriptional regulator [Actinoplanes sp.]